MSIFNLYPKVSYKIDDYDFIKAIDITNSIRIRDYIKNYRGISYEPYFVKDGEKPDLVAYKLYGDSSLDWIVLLANNMYNIYEEWPKDTKEFENYIVEKYGNLMTALNTVKYYYDKDGNIIDETTYNALPPADRKVEMQYQYELRRNINKARIRVINRNVVGAIQSDLRTLLYKPVK
jgi:hypothetical protein